MKCADGSVQFIFLEPITRKYLYISLFIDRLQKKQIVSTAFHKLKRRNMLYKPPASHSAIYTPIPSIFSNTRHFSAARDHHQVSLMTILSENILYTYSKSVLPVPVAARSKAQVCGYSPAEIGGSNPTGCMDGCLLWVLCVVRQRSLRRADHSSRGVLPNVVRRCV